jgi:hypothetical protein
MAPVGAVARQVSFGPYLADKSDAERIHRLYLDRLQTPHAGTLPFDPADTDIQSTFNSYNAFCSVNAPNDYEKRLVIATEASQVAKKVMSVEKRYGKTRQEFEDALVSVNLRTLTKGDSFRSIQQKRDFHRIHQMGDGCPRKITKP